MSGLPGHVLPPPANSAASMLDRFYAFAARARAVRALADPASLARAIIRPARIFARSHDQRGITLWAFTAAGDLMSITARFGRGAMRRLLGRDNNAIAARLPPVPPGADPVHQRLFDQLIEAGHGAPLIDGAEAARLRELERKARRRE